MQIAKDNLFRISVAPKVKQICQLNGGEFAVCVCSVCGYILCVCVCGSCKQTKLRTFGKQLNKQSLQFKRQFIFDFCKVNAPPLFKVPSIGSSRT